ncbi:MULTISPECIES: 1-aminocyclopropane-1-carboxylate deaminase/D-cysteine desulfhydrase [Micromonospora]|uniref:1-aminocyclopropane-1-carboxylate deaminase/D-cysteine desulfhydrase n=1 Tax=Micromonospora chalcea TaxID=1874 RepID=UPI002379075F|nr:pyridoxal-phosphate dependent enzyme [Micromonospora chalcea]WDQ00499.1 pyridoxal-phosphate dependent enzyme [Micromonospora chalcea]
MTAFPSRPGVPRTTLTTRFPPSPLESWDQIGHRLGVRLLVKRDDLLPFPLAGNKVRKLTRELATRAVTTGDVLITSGGVDSNHCRTAALLGARLGIHVDLVLHSRAGNAAQDRLSVRVARALGAAVHVVSAAEMPDCIDALHKLRIDSGKTVHVVPGGCHTKAGVEAYADAAGELLDQIGTAPDAVVLASGTGATQAGLVAGLARAGCRTRVIGISVARPADKGCAAVREALAWSSDDTQTPIEFLDSFVDGGYGCASDATRDAVRRAWRLGLPLDSTYTGKAFRGLTELTLTEAIPSGATVVFWHTGGLMNQLVE